MLRVDTKVTITLSDEDVKAFSLLCKTMCSDAATRLSDEDREKAQQFAAKCNSYEEIWHIR